MMVIGAETVGSGELVALAVTEAEVVEVGVATWLADRRADRDEDGEWDGERVADMLLLPDGDPEKRVDAEAVPQKDSPLDAVSAADAVRCALVAVPPREAEPVVNALCEGRPADAENCAEPLAAAALGDSDADAQLVASEVAEALAASVALHETDAQKLATVLSDCCTLPEGSALGDSVMLGLGEKDGEDEALLDKSGDRLEDSVPVGSAVVVGECGALGDNDE